MEKEKNFVKLYFSLYLGLGLIIGTSSPGRMRQKHIFTKGGPTMNQKNPHQSSIYSLLNDFSNVKELISNFNIQSFLSSILNSIMIKERDWFLEQNPNSSKNGFYNRKSFSINSIPIHLSIPRTRDSSFFPSIIPKYSRIIPDDYKNLVEALILSSK